jgi:L-alanine-DL-glutamate epimerase-like enolase superfamily enzyme
MEAAIPNFTIHEHHVCNRMDTSKGLTKYNLQPVNGSFSLPELPGLGNEFLESAISNACMFKSIE